jgi:hypothetical protein
VRPRPLLLLLLLPLLAGCLSVDSSVDSGCTSSYRRIADADSWSALRAAMIGHDDGRGRTASLRVHDRGRDLAPSHGEDVVRVVDLLDRRGRRLVQVNVWRTGDGGWAAGAWQQCID